MPDFTQVSKFNEDANFSSVIFGADAPLLETELNELQDIQSHKLSKLVKSLLTDGIKDLKAISTQVSNGVINVTINNTQAIVEGEIIDISNLTKEVNEGQKLYLQVKKEVISYQDSIVKGGNKQSLNTVVNDILDSRVNEETSRRYQTTYDLVLENVDTDANYLLIGEVINNTFITRVKEIRGVNAGGSTVGSETSRLLALLYATSEINSVVEGYTGVFFDLFNGLTEGSIAQLDTTKAKCIDAVTKGVDTLSIVYFEQGMEFKVGQEVTVYDDVNVERKTIESINGNIIKFTSPLLNNYKANVNIARSICTIDTLNETVELGTWDYVNVTFE